MFETLSIGVIVVLALDVWVIVSVMGSGASTGAKVLWILIVLALPIAGFILWLIVGPKAR